MSSHIVSHECTPALQGHHIYGCDDAPQIGRGSIADRVLESSSYPPARASDPAHMAALGQSAEDSRPIGGQSASGQSRRKTRSQGQADADPAWL